MDWAEVPIPGSYSDLYEYYGDPFSNPTQFENKYIVTTQHEISTGMVNVRSHVAIAERLHNVWQAFVDQGLIGQLRSYDGCYVVRNIRNSSKPSLHAWGLAIDLNASTNQQGTRGDMPLEIIKIFQGNEFFWGGEFYRIPDPMHFQFTKPHTI